MANPNPSPSTRFGKGKSGNPSGSVKLPPAVREARKLSLQQFIESTLKLLHMTATELRELMSNPYTPGFELVIAGVIVNGAREGDMSAVNQLLDRCFGKAPMKIDLQTDNYRKDLESLTDEDLARIELIFSGEGQNESEVLP